MFNPLNFKVMNRDSIKKIIWEIFTEMAIEGGENVLTEKREKFIQRLCLEFPDLRLRNPEKLKTVEDFIDEFFIESCSKDELFKNLLDMVRKIGNISLTLESKPFYHMDADEHIEIITEDYEDYEDYDDNYRKYSRDVMRSWGEFFDRFEAKKPGISSTVSKRMSISGFAEILYKEGIFNF